MQINNNANFSYKFILFYFIVVIAAIIHAFLYTILSPVSLLPLYMEASKVIILSLSGLLTLFFIIGIDADVCTGFKPL